MKTSFQKFNILLFLIALFNIQFFAALELSSVAKLQKAPKEENFEQLCYYDLKQELIIRNYVIRIKDECDTIYEVNKYTKRDEITFQFFWQVFREGKYGQIAPELAGSEDYVRAYWNYFTSGEKMTEDEFIRFMGLYYLEGELLIIEKHPTITEFFPNEHNVMRHKGCDVALAYWALVSELMHRIFVQFKWSQTSKVITVSEIFTILTNTHSGKCQLFNGKKCKFFTEYIEKIMGFFNMSTGNRPTMTIPELKISYSTMLFNDLYKPLCENKEFDPKKLNELIEKIGL